MSFTKTRTLRAAGRLALAGGLALASIVAARAAIDSCPDALITADVKARLAVKSPTGALKINVETDECVVTLKGCAKSSDLIRKMVAAARKVKKVKAVKNQLTVCSG